MAGIYIQSGIHTELKGKGFFAYYGLDSSDDWKRLDVHYRKLKKGTHTNKSIQNFYNQWGENQIFRGAVIECDEYYLSALEKAYIFQGDTNRKYNPYGWNGSAGGEGATPYQIPYSFIKNDIIHEGDNLLQFLTISGQSDPSGFVGLLDGRIKEYDGFSIYSQ